MDHKEAARAEILQFVTDWFKKQVDYQAADPSSYDGVNKDDWVLWFWESGGEL